MKRCHIFPQYLAVSAIPTLSGQQFQHLAVPCAVPAPDMHALPARALHRAVRVGHVQELLRREQAPAWP
eukprot:5081113-Prymnesium_polylepis.1